jgi:hypothetical protein
MSNASAVLRSLIVYGLCLPLAVCLGYLLANPLDLTTVTVVSIILLLLLVPLLLRWHHTWLILTWNTSAVVALLPGRPSLWSVIAAISFFIGVLQYAINRNLKFLYVPSVARPLIFLTVVVLITARLTGGIGLQVLGSSTYGGRYYILILTAVLGFFALTSRQISPKHATLYVMLFFLSAAVTAIGELAWVLPSQFNFLYVIFPLISAGALDQQSATAVTSSEETSRVMGLVFPALGVYYAMLARYGIRGIFFGAKPWRAIVLVAMIAIGSLSGFRSMVIVVLMVFVVLFFLEGLHHSRLLPIFLLTGLLGGSLLLAFANRLPFAMQRSLAFLPIEIDPTARLSATASSGWRLQMWKDILPEVPKYLILGKGYGFNARDMEMVYITHQGGSAGSQMAGDYHNGPLSVLIPFGLFGMLGFCWFMWAGVRTVYQNYRFGDPAYRQANAFLFAYFLVKIVFFCFVFGSFVSDLFTLAGLAGLSISLNGGVAKPAVVPQPKIVFNRFRLHPSARRPVSA